MTAMYLPPGANGTAPEIFYDYDALNRRKNVYGSGAVGMNAQGGWKTTYSKTYVNNLLTVNTTSPSSYHTQTVSLNQADQVASINYDNSLQGFPSADLSKPNTSFAYDAAGRRKSMQDV